MSKSASNGEPMRAANAIADLASLSLFFGDASDALCRIYARAEGEGTLTGTLTGPYCDYAQTLPAKFPLVDRGPGPYLLAEAIVPEPCFWTPGLPQYYLAEVQLRRGDQVVASVQRPLGIRRLGASGRNLLFERKRYVLRGVSKTLAPRVNLAEWREAGAVMLVDKPDDQLCAEASRLGVLLVARVPAVRLECDIRRLGQHAAVGMVIVDGTLADAKSLHAMAPNLLFAQSFAANETIAPASWAQVAWCEVGERAHFGKRTKDCRVPMIAVSSLPADDASLVSARAACDALQAALAPQGDFAGYFVQ